MSVDMTSAALPPISQDFARPSLSDTRRPATSAGIIQLSGAALPGTNSLGGQNGMMGSHNQMQNQNAFNAMNNHNQGMMGMRLNGSAKGLHGSNMSADLARRSSLGLSAIDENNPTGSNQKAPMTSHNQAYRVPTGGGGPPGSSGGMSNPSNMLRRESDANYAGVFAHTVEDANISPQTGRRDSMAPTFNNPFPTSVLDPALLSGGSRPGSQQQQQHGVRFQSPAEPPQNHMDYYSASNAWRRASEPQHKHAQNGYASLPNSSALYGATGMNGYPATNNSLSMRDLHIATSHGRTDDAPATAPVFGSMQQPSPTSANSFASAPDPRSSSYNGGNHGYPPASHMQQWQYGSFPGNAQGQAQAQAQAQQAAQRRRSTQGATTGYYSTSGNNANEVSRRPSIVEGSHQGYSHEARHSIGVPPSGQWNGFPIDYRFGDVPPQHRSSTASVSSQMAQGMPSGHMPPGYPMGSYPDPNGGFVQPYDDVRNNSYSTGSTQSRVSRQSFEARLSDAQFSDPLRRNSTTSTGNGRYSGDDGSHDPASGPSTKKRPRRRFDQIERLYTCRWEGCEKAYGTLNHLNAHVSMQKHGIKRKPEEFKDVRKAWRKRKKEDARLAAEQAQRTGVMDPAAAEAMAWEAEGKWLAH